MSVLIVALLAACAGSPGSQGPGEGSGALPAGENETDQRTLDSQATSRIEEVLAMGQPERDAALADVGLELELAVAKESGLEAELGGPDATRAALIAAWAPIVEQAGSAADAVQSTGFRRGSPRPPSIGEGFFGGLIVVALGSGVAASSGLDQAAGAAVSETKDGFTVSGSLNRGEFSSDVTHEDTTTGVTTKLATKTSVVPCPDADGRFEAQATLDVSVSKGAVGQRGMLIVSVVGHVDDDARLASSESEFTMEWTRSSGAGAGAELVRFEGTSSSDGTGTSRETRSVTAASSELDSLSTLGAHLWAALLTDNLIRAATGAWESGKCVRLDVTADPPGRSVPAGATVDVTGAPRSTMDGGPVGGNVTATLTGVVAVEPNGSPIPPDATFVYTAPTENLPNNGKVFLEARSRRGVGKASIQFETDRVPYIASGSGPEITFSGSTGRNDPTLGFTVQGDFTGGSATFDFVGDSDAEGNSVPTGVVTITGGGNGAVVTGSGTYTLVANEDGTLTVTMTTHSCVDVSGACRDSTDVITLTPASG